MGASARTWADTSPRDPLRGPLHALLRVYLAERAEAGAPLPGFVLEELRAGCARYECEGCGAVRVTARGARAEGA